MKNGGRLVLCAKCALNICANGPIKQEKNMRFGFPMIWREPKNHHDDCYFSCVNVMGIGSKNRKNLQYPQVESVSRPLPHSDGISIPIFKRQTSSLLSDSCSSMSMRGNSDPEYFQQIEPQFFNQQAELSDLIRDLNLSKENYELLASIG